MTKVQLRRTLMLVALCCLAALPAMSVAAFKDPDIWWHLRVGQWIAENHTVPTVDYFSTQAGRPWVAYSWLFEILVYGMYHSFGPNGVLIIAGALALAIAVALYRLLATLCPSFSLAYALSAVGLFGLARLYSPRPWLFTILFFILEVHILLRAREFGDRRSLWLLLPLFALWANLHIQFVYGLMLLALASIEPLLSIPGNPKPEPYQPRYLLASFTFLSAAASLVNPYGWKIYRVIVEYASQGAAFRYVSELRAPTFHSPADWVMLFAAIFAAMVLGWRRNLEPLPVLALLTAVAISFRASRDSWFVLVIALCILAGWGSAKLRKGTAFTSWKQATAVVVLTSLVLGGLRLRELGEKNIETAVSNTYPVAAAEFIEKKGLAGPLFNTFDWGGYLIWRLPALPVSMDGRTNLYGESAIARHYETWMGAAEWQSDPQLSAAKVVIADVRLPLTSLLRTDSRFALAYEDSLAAVFVRR